ncbi:hypothetical protein LZ31DRAFT_236260 [Colletotrichum somersetense]|nr:hypothetical protein LZ31DRAFT_236260 [Colletotrichum somersetense]
MIRHVSGRAIPSTVYLSSQGLGLHTPCSGLDATGTYLYSSLISSFENWQPTSGWQARWSVIRNWRVAVSGKEGCIERERERERESATNAVEACGVWYGTIRVHSLALAVGLGCACRPWRGCIRQGSWKLVPWLSVTELVEAGELLSSVAVVRPKGNVWRRNNNGVDYVLEHVSKVCVGDGEKWKQRNNKTMCRQQPGSLISMPAYQVCVGR